MKTKVVACAILGFILTACSASRAPKIQIGGIFQDSLTVGAYDMAIPLPKGEWKLIGHSVWSNDAQIQFNEVLLIQTKGNKLSKFVDVRSTIYPKMNSWGYTSNKFCNRNDIIHIVSRANFDGSKHDCWGINHWRMTLGKNASAYWIQGYEYMKTNHIAIPINALIARHHKADERKWLTVIYGFNPELEGIPAPIQAEWSSSDWHKNRYYTDKRKVDYIEKIKRWADSLEEQINQGFMGKLQPIATQHLTASDKLIQLKELFDTGIITEDEYKAKKQELLKSL